MAEQAEEYWVRFDQRNLVCGGMVFMGGRRTERLNGTWRFSPDPYDTGLRDNWHTVRVPDENGVVPPWDYGVDDGIEITVPCSWNRIAPEFFWLEGSAWFARRFRYHQVAGDERVFLRIGAANYDAKVFLNQRFLGNHAGGSTPFFVELTETLEEENVIQVCVNNTRTGDRVPMKNTDWFNWGGIYRDVELVRLPPAFIADFRVHLVPNGAFDTIEIAAEVTGNEPAVRIEIPELGIERELVPVDGRVRVQVPARPELWSPDSPRLYEVAAHYGADTVRDSIGFREVRVRGMDILLNGKPVWLRGVSVHEDDTRYGKASSIEDIERRFAHAKELGCNFMRLAHYPHHELAARIADRVGIMLWEEIPVYWTIDFENPRTYADAYNQLMELIRRDYNRASVIVWSVGNENLDTDARLEFMSGLAAAARAEDPARLVSAACLVNDSKNRIEDRLSEHLDVIGLNEYYGWYETDFDKLIDLGENSRPDKPVIITEFGAGSRAGHHGSVSDKFTEEFAEDLYERQLGVIDRLAYVRGITPWILYDFACPRRHNRFQQGFNRKGLISDDKQTKKLPFFVLQRYFRGRIDSGR